MKIGGNSISILNRSLDYLWEKQGVISHNIANVDTPLYQSRTVLFEQDFQRELEQKFLAQKQGVKLKNPVHAQTRVMDKGGITRPDGNNVNMEIEQMEMTRTLLQYQYGVESVNQEISRLRAAIKG